MRLSDGDRSPSHRDSCGGTHRVLLSTALLCILLGCSTIREDVGQPLVVDERSLADAEDYHSVLATFGPPHRVSIGEAGMVFLYEEIDVFETQLGINLSGGRTTLFKAVAARGNAERRVLSVFFDQGGQTRAIHYEEREEAAARGAALQFIFAVASVVEDDDLSAPPQVHDWGVGLLEADLPVALNRAQNLDLGNRGLQQQATPDAVGQRTLELHPR
jgi:hypothetical protein